MDRLLKLAWTAFALAGAVAFLAIAWDAWSARGIVRPVDGVLTRAEAVESKFYATAGNLDQSTKVWAQASTDQTRQVIRLANTAEATLTAAQGALAGAQTVLGSTNDQIVALGPILRDSDALIVTTNGAVGTVSQDAADLHKAIDDADDLLGSADLLHVLTNLDRATAATAGTMESLNGIAANGRIVSDRATVTYLKPRPWYLRPLGRAGELLDIGAAIARNAP